MQRRNLYSNNNSNNAEKTIAVQRRKLCKNDNCTIMPRTIDKIAQRRNLCKNDNFKKDGNYSKTEIVQRRKLCKDEIVQYFSLHY